MKELKLYLESILDKEDDLATNYEDIIWKFLHDNYNWAMNRDSFITIRYDKKDGCIVDSIVGVTFASNKLKNLTNGLFRWGKVKDFVCSFCDNLESLEGAPKECRHFSCRECKNLKVLNSTINECESFDCSQCENLVSLEGAPKKCKRFYCDYCKNLKTLEGAPEECDRFDCFCNDSLISLKGAPEKVTFTFNCEYCPSLESYDYLPDAKTVLK